MKKNKGQIINLWIITAIFFLKFGFLTNPIMAEKSQLTIAVPFGPTNSAPDPRARQNGWLSNRAGVSETLLGLDYNMRLFSRLAKSYENIAPTQWQFKLRQGVKFHDGSLVDASAVKASLEKIEDKEHPAYNIRLSKLLDLNKIEVVDPLTLIFHTNTPNAAFPWALTEPSAAVMKDGTKDLPLIGTGPFVFVSAVANQSYEVRAFQDYWAGHPRAEAIRIDAIPDSTTAMLALNSGDVDLVTNYPEADFTRLQKQKTGQLFSNATTRLFFYQLRVTDGITASSQMRQAISLALDRDLIVEVALSGVGGEKANGIFPESMASWYNSDVALPYNPEKAKALLKEIGMVDTNNDGVLEMNGKEVVIYIRTYEGRPALKPTIEITQALLSQVGLKSVVSIGEFGANNDALKRGEIQMHLQAWGTAPIGDPSYFPETLLKSDASNNIGGYANDELNQLLKAGRMEFDQEKRKTIYHRVQSIVNEDLPLIPLFHKKQTSVGNGKIVGYQIHPAETYLTNLKLGQE